MWRDDFNKRTSIRESLLYDDENYIRQFYLGDDVDKTNSSNKINLNEPPIVWDVEMKNQLGVTAKFKAIVVDDSPKSGSYKVVLEMISQKNNDGFSHFCEFETIDYQDLD